MSNPTVVLLVFSFGVPYNNTSNQALSDYVESLINSYPKTTYLIYTQNAIQFKNPDIGEKATYFPQKAKEIEPRTLRIARKLTQWAPQDVAEILLIAATPHRERAYRDTLRALKEAKLSIPVRLARFNHPLSSFGENDYRLWFDRNGTQLWTRFFIFWIIGEGLINKLPWFIYRLIAK